MDAFGIGAAMKGMARVYFQSARASGRTWAMVQAAKDGDRIIFATQQEARRVERMLREAGKHEVKCIVRSVEDRHRLAELGTATGRTVFDHSWVEDFYMRALESAGKEIDFLQERLSGEFGPAHYETRLRAIELSKWGA